MLFNLSDIDILSSATRAFVQKDRKLNGLIGEKHPYYSLPEAIESKRHFFSAEKRNLLADRLMAQYSNIAADDEAGKRVKANIDKLRQPSTFTVTTGQQLHLFLGPAFVLYKIIATIKATEDFRRQYPDLDFIPVYWLASEDHDFEEIRKTKVFQRTFDWNTGQTGASGRFHVRDVQTIISDIRQNIHLSSENSALTDLFEQIYSSSSTLSEASIRSVHALFGSFGLVCIDGDHADLKRQFIPQIKQDILERKNIRLMDDADRELEHLDLSLQLKGRDINMFYLTENRRSRIVFEEGLYKILDSPLSFTEPQLIADIESNAENYSPNAVLRPVYQEAILPNVCYIAGNAEVNYWLQLTNVFEANRVPPPMLALRPSLWVIPEKIIQWLENRNISSVGLFQSEQVRSLLRLLDHSEQPFRDKSLEFNLLRQSIQDLAAGEKTSFLKELAELGKQYEKLLKKIDKELADKQLERMEADYKKLESIKTGYYDLHHIQERHISSLEMLIKYESFISRIYNSLEFKPSSGQILVL